MDLSLSETDEAIVASFRALFEKHSSIETVRSAEPLGFDQNLWEQLTAVDLIGMATRDAHGVAAGLVELQLVAREAGGHLAPAPVAESLVAARAIDRAAGSGGIEELGSGALCTVALRRVSGDEVHLLSAGAVATHAVVFDGGALRVVELVGEVPRPAPSNLGCLPVANVRVGRSVCELANGEDAMTQFEVLIDDWMALVAAELLGLAVRSFEIGLQYTKDRTVFGLPIGWYQSVAHRLADSVTALDALTLLVFKSGWARDEGREDASKLATMAFLYSSELAQRVTSDVLHFHGGSGYTMEVDAQLFFRQATARPLMIGDLRGQYERLARRAFGEGGRR